MRDGHSNEARIHKAAARGNALVVLIHGGGFCLGHNSHINSYSRSIASFFNVNVVSISYRLAPEFKFPTAPNDVWDAIEWLVKQDNRQTLGYEPSAGFLVGGVSAGANLAAVTVQRWGSEKLSPPISGAWLGIPWLMDEDIVPSDYQGLWFSREQNADSFIVGKEALEFMKEAYAPETTSPAFSPLNTKGSYENHPPTYIQVCGKDPLRDDGLIYEKLLREQGVSTRMDVYPGVPHGFADVFPELKIARKYRIDTMKGFGWLLGNEPHERAYAEAFEGITGGV
ncbi:alpha/beta hydrolase fold-3 domain-containing protein, partial [Metarhizium majus ARSEF 297]